MKVVVDFGICETTFKETGRMTITFRINDPIFDKVLCDKAGNRHFENRVPLEFLKARNDNPVGMKALSFLLM